MLIGIAMGFVAFHVNWGIDALNALKASLKYESLCESRTRHQCCGIVRFWFGKGSRTFVRRFCYCFVFLVVGFVALFGRHFLSISWVEKEPPQKVLFIRSCLTAWRHQ